MPQMQLKNVAHLTPRHHSTATLLRLASHSSSSAAANFLSSNAPTKINVYLRTLESIVSSRLTVRVPVTLPTNAPTMALANVTPLNAQAHAFAHPGTRPAQTIVVCPVLTKPWRVQSYQPV